MANLSDTINDSKGTQAAGEKLRCLRAIQEMIKIAKSNVNNALPQVRISQVLRLVWLLREWIDLRMSSLCH